MTDQPYLEQMRAHVDEGGKLTHQNAIYLLSEVERLVTVINSITKELTEMIKIVKEIQCY